MEDDTETLESPIENPSDLQQMADGLTAARTQAGADQIEETEQPAVGITDDDGMTPEDAADALANWREARAAEIDAFNKAIGLDVEAPVSPDTPVSPADPAAEQPAEQPPQEPLAPPVRDFAAERAALVAENNQYVQQLRTAQEVLRSDFARNFPEIRSPAEAAALQASNPQRFAQAVQYAMVETQLLNQQNEVARQAVEQQRQVFEEWAKSQDDEWDKQHPEVASDPAVKTQLAKVAKDLLKSQGITDAELQAMWNGEAHISLRDKRTQSILLDAAKYRMAQQVMKTKGPKVAKPVQRPGRAQDETFTSRVSIRDAEHRLKNSSGMAAMDAAVELLQAQRASRG